MGRTILSILVLAGLALIGYFLLFHTGPSGDTVTADYLTVTGPCDFKFPDDHGAHPGYRTEWWYYTGNVADASGRPFGFQLTFFRSQIHTLREMKNLPSPASKWRTSQLYFAHAAVSDIRGENFLHDSIMARGAAGLAGAGIENETAAVHVHDWSAIIGPANHEIRSRTRDFSIALTLTQAKDIVAHGDRGYSRKGRSPERASCYYSFTRLQAAGDLVIGDRVYAVTGSAWMDHEYSSAPLEKTAVGWDWFSLQLDDHTELMLFQIREENGGISPASSGTYIDPTGRTRRLGREEITLTVRSTWKSPQSGAVYPSQWEIQVPTLDLFLTITSNLSDQELDTTQTTGVTYWEGSVSVTGRKESNDVSGRGYAELTGYAVRFRSPL